MLWVYWMGISYQFINLKVNRLIYPDIKSYTHKLSKRFRLSNEFFPYQTINIGKHADYLIILSDAITLLRNLFLNKSSGRDLTLEWCVSLNTCHTNFR